MSSPQRSPRRTLDPASQPRILVLGAISALALVGILVLAFTAPNGTPGVAQYGLTVQLDDLRNLGERGADVRIAGRRVGQTRDGRLEDGVPTVDLQLDADAGPLPADTTVRVRPRGLLGAQYLDVVPGRSPAMLESGATLDIRASSAAVQLPDVIDTFDPATRVGLGQTLRGLGGGVAGRGDELGEVLDVLPGLARDLSAALRPVLAREGTIARFIARTDDLMRALAPVRREMAAGFGDGADALAPFADERERLGETFTVAADAFPAVRRSLAASRPVLAEATRFSRSAAAFTDPAPRALDALAELLVDGRPAMGDLRDVLREARDATGPVVSLARSLAPTLPRLRATALLAREPVTELARYGCDIALFGRTWRSYLGHGPVGAVGPMGPVTTLRAVLVGAQPVEADLSRVYGGGYDADPAPCLPKGGRP